ncbi:hypothetical protein [Thioalkalivibrio sp. ALE12]|uniref:hypothetical protein n=1 Tax=Thioalkalivibrio sp. ALE12 TaxID=1158170 RepID=UPI00035E9108|nr:hypothetical protein [Thioalkalivibrio sp. ALE12]
MNAPEPINETAPATDWNHEVSKRLQRLQTIEQFSGLIAEGAMDDNHCMYWWVENEIRTAREYLDSLYREFGARKKGNPGSEQVLTDLDKRTLRLQTIIEAGRMLVECNEAPSAIWFWIANEAAAADELIGRLWDACREASGLKTVTV